jgi:RNA polymerase sigma-70 factor (ECF subfamily)
MPTPLEIFERHHQSVFRFLGRLEGSVERAEDLTQEVFLRILKSLAWYEDQQTERAWVFRIARNVWIDHRRASSRAPQESSLEAEVIRFPAMQTHRIALDQALGELGDADREAFLMRELGGLGYAEIAQATGATPDAVRNRIYRARMALRKTLSEETPRPLAAGGREE